MAYKSNLTASSSFHDLSSVSGVPVKIADKYLPPKKVTLPLKYETSFQKQNPSEVLFMEYNFDLEEQVIQWSEAYKQCQSAYNQVESEKVGESIEEFSRIVPDEPVIQGDADADNETQNSDGTHQPQIPTANSNIAVQPFLNGEVQRPTSTEPPAMRPKDDARQPNLNPFSVGTDILVPMQVPTKTNTVLPIKGDNKGSFDLADFEQEQDPFDNAEMRVMNDLEELNKVLQNAQCPVPEVPKDDSGEGATRHGQGRVTGAGAAHLDVAASHTVRLVEHGAFQKPKQSSQPKSIKEIEYPELDSLESTKSNFSNNSFGAAVPSSHIPNSCAVNFPAQSSVQNSVQPGTGPFAPTSVAMSLNSGNPFTRPPPVSNPFLGQTVNPYSIEQSSNPFVTNAVSYNKQTDTAQLYASGKPVVNGSQMPSQSNPYSFGFLSHGTGYPNVVQELEKSDSFGKQLRSCRSTPDISALSDNTPIHFPTSHTPPPNPQAQQTYLESEKRRGLNYNRQPSQPLFSDTNPWGNYPIKPATTTCATSPSSNSTATNSWNGHSRAPVTVAIPKKLTTSLPDPYLSMSPEAKTLVNNVTAMGFPRSCVARTVQTLGTDDKQVIDFLCLVTRLTEGGHSADDAEVALHLYESKQEKAEEYLKLAAHLRELGFTKDKIKDALVTSQLDENKALDILTGS